MSGAGLAHADGAAQYEAARARFDAGKYQEAAERLSAMLDPKTPECDARSPNVGETPCRLTEPEQIERARLLYSASLVALGRRADAKHEIAMILRQNPSYRPSAASVAPEVMDAFAEVRSELREELEAAARMIAERERKDREREEEARRKEEAKQADRERRQGTETVVEYRSRWIAAIPFGVGQFQNEQPGLGWTVLSLEALTGAASIASALVANYYAAIDTSVPVTDDGGNVRRVDRATVEEKFNTARLVNRISFGTLAGITLLGIAQAQAAFVPEKRTTRRPGVEATPVVPEMTATETGWMLGCSGRF